MTDSPNNAGSPTAEDLARSARDGSSAAFAALVDRYADRLFRFLRHKAPTHHDAEDLVQETFLRAFGNIRRYSPGRRFSTWLFTIASRLAVSHHRARRPRIDVQSMEVADGRARDPNEAASQREQRDSLWARAANDLTESQFDVLWLRYAEDMPVKEIAAALGKTRIHVKVLLHRARRRLGAQPAGWIESPAPQGPKLAQQSPIPARGGTCGAE